MTTMVSIGRISVLSHAKLGKASVRQSVATSVQSLLRKMYRGLEEMGQLIGIKFRRYRNFHEYDLLGQGQGAFLFDCCHF